MALIIIVGTFEKEVGTFEKEPVTLELDALMPCNFGAWDLIYSASWCTWAI